jgi:Tetratricopeptide repeat
VKIRAAPRKATLVKALLAAIVVMTATSLPLSVVLSHAEARQSATPAPAVPFQVPPEAVAALDQTYAGNPREAIRIAREIEKKQSDSALGYVLENEARWSVIYCASCEIKWGMVDGWRRPKTTAKNAAGEVEDDAYVAAADRALELATASIARTNSAADHLYAGMANAQKARLFGLRDETRATAKFAVAARTEFLKALEIDPQMADASAGLGLYNYYVDSLSSIVKMLRFFMGIPGGSKVEGLKQLEDGMQRGVLMKVTARFYLAKNLRTYDLDYARASGYLAPLLQQYPQNPSFALLMANLEIEQGQREAAAKRLQAIAAMPIYDPDCAARTKKLADEMLAATR